MGAWQSKKKKFLPEDDSGPVGILPSKADLSPHGNFGPPWAGVNNDPSGPSNNIGRTENGSAGKFARPLPPPPSGSDIGQTKDTFVVKAMYDFKKLNPDDLSFKKGDKLLVDKSANSAARQITDWWLATHMKNGNKGYIPSNYVCKDDNSVQTQEWFFDVKRPEAERKLLHAGIKEGTFLLRPASDPKNFALSVRHCLRGQPSIKHYQIRMMDDGVCCYITDRRTFSSVFELISHYSDQPDGLCTPLRNPCPRTAPVVPMHDLEVQRDAVKVLQKLGQGCFGDVHKGKLHGSLQVAVKTLKTGTSMTPEAFLGEAQIMHRLRHDRLVQLLAVCSRDEPIWIITELMVNGSLLSYLRQEGSVTNLSIVIDMAAQIAEGMKYLESAFFVHRDLRAANILVGEHHDVKVADFGLARPLGEEEDVYEAAENAKFPVKWTAPEAALYRQFSTKSDVWSFGVLLYELITLGKTPYPGMAGKEVLKEVQNGYRMPKPTGQLVCPDDYYGIMCACWKMEAAGRPTFEFLHDVFENWNVATEHQYDMQNQRC